MNAPLSSPQQLRVCVLFLLAFPLHGQLFSFHPPEFHHSSVNSNIQLTSQQQPSNFPTEEQKQLAYFHFEFFTQLIHRLPDSLQAKLIDHAQAEYNYTTNHPDALKTDILLTRRSEILKQLESIHHTLHFRFDGKNVVAEEPLEPIHRSENIERYVLLRLTNQTDSLQPVTVKLQDRESLQKEPWPIFAKQSQYFLIRLPARTDSGADKGVFEKLSFSVNQSTYQVDVPVIWSLPAKLSVELVDLDMSQTVPGRVWMEGSDHQYRHAGPWANHQTFLEKPLITFPVPRSYAVPFFYANESFEAILPPGETTIHFERGFEHPRVTETITLKPGETKTLKLTTRKFLDLQAQGWISGDTHIHWVTNAWNVDMPLEDLAVIQRAEDLHVANNLTLLHRKYDDAFLKPSQSPVGSIRKLSDSNYHLEMAEEYRNQNLYGHLCFLNLRWLVQPVGTGPQIAGDDSLDFPLNRTAIHQVRQQGGISIEAHGLGNNHEIPQNVIHGLTDSLDQIEPEDYYRLLDCGFQLPLTNGSDHPARPIGCARAYVKVNGQFNYEKWIDGIRRGRTFTTSGPLLLLDVDNKGPGDTLITTPKHRLKVTLRAYSRFPIGKVQIVSNGEVLKEIESQENTLETSIDLPAATSRWIVARCSSSGTFNPIMAPNIAHTSAVYVYVDGKPVYRESAAREWIARMRLHLRDIQIRGQFADQSQLQEATAYTEDSINRYEHWIESRKREPKPINPPFAKQRSDLLLLTSFLDFDQRITRVSPADFTRSLAVADDILTARKLLEPMTLFRINVNPESRVKLFLVNPPKVLIKDRTSRFLLEVENLAGVEAPLHLVAMDQTQNPPTVASWCDIRILDNMISSSQMSGAESEWKLVEIRMSEAGTREVRIEADAGQGTQDLGFRAATDLLLKCETPEESKERGFNSSR